VLDGVPFSPNSLGSVLNLLDRVLNYSIEWTVTRSSGSLLDRVTPLATFSAISALKIQNFYHSKPTMGTLEAPKASYQSYNMGYHSPNSVVCRLTRLARHSFYVTMHYVQWIHSQRFMYSRRNHMPQKS